MLSTISFIGCLFLFHKCYHTSGFEVICKDWWSTFQDLFAILLCCTLILIKEYDSLSGVRFSAMSCDYIVNSRNISEFESWFEDTNL